MWMLSSLHSRMSLDAHLHKHRKVIVSSSSMTRCTASYCPSSSVSRTARCWHTIWVCMSHRCMMTHRTSALRYIVSTCIRIWCTYLCIQQHGCQCKKQQQINQSICVTSHGDHSHQGNLCRVTLSSQSELSHQAAAHVESSRVTSHGDLSHHGGNCPVESQRERPLA